MWRQVGDKKLQLIATQDFGDMAVEALLHMDREEYRNKAVSIAGHEFSAKEAPKIFQAVSG